jgi:hypothetical protein
LDAAHEAWEAKHLYPGVNRVSVLDCSPTWSKLLSVNKKETGVSGSF